MLATATVVHWYTAYLQPAAVLGLLTFAVLLGRNIYGWRRRHQDDIDGLRERLTKLEACLDEQHQHRRPWWRRVGE